MKTAIEVAGRIRLRAKLFAIAGVLLGGAVFFAIHLVVAS